MDNELQHSCFIISHPIANWGDREEPDNQEVFEKILDETLRENNSDYDAKRYKDMVLKAPKVNVVPKETFYAWMRNRGKLGGQHKVPRLSNSREFVEEILLVAKEVLV